MIKKEKYWTGAHTKRRMLYHIVWIPKYRKRILEGKLSQRLLQLLTECAEVNRWHIDELNVQKDHVHIVIQFVPTVAVSKMVQLLKGKSSKVVREEFTELEEVYWGDSFWADG